MSEESRHHLYQRLEEVLGHQEATTLMEHLLPVGWADVATRQDLEALRTATKADIEGLRAATKADIEGLRAATKVDIDGLRAATKADIYGLRAATKADIDGLRAATKADLEALRAGTRQDIDSAVHAEINRLLLWLVPTLLTTLGLVFAVAFAAAKLS